MQHLEEIAERIHTKFETRTSVRDQLLAQARTLTRHCANAIRAAHREDRLEAAAQLAEAKRLAGSFQDASKDYPDLYYAGYTQDALKEYAEANIVYTLLDGPNLPSPEDLGLEASTYLQGLAEAVGELRRRSLDVLLKGDFQEAQRLLGYMDNIYDVLVTMDYPDAITGGLRRLTDIARSIIERTRGDLTLSLRQDSLEKAMRLLEDRLGTANSEFDL
ncbi:MAG: haloacid dehalogenase [Anaerolineales bacterium]|jgi:translin|nr:haloacid dehalogenase [Anaerolineales bacterium]